MKFYLAARYSRRLEMVQYAADLVRFGHQVTARWIDGNHEATNEQLAADPDLPQRFGQEDIEDLVAADVLVCFTEEPGSQAGRGRGGRHVELGVALGWNAAVDAFAKLISCPVDYEPKRFEIIAIGPVENVSYGLPGIHRYDTWEQYIVLELWPEWARRRGESESEEETP